MPDPNSSSQWTAANCNDFSIIDGTPTGTTNVVLSGPDSQYRMVIVQAVVNVRDADCFTSDDWGGPYTYYRTCTVGPHDGEKVATLQEMDQRQLCADEAGVKMNGTCTWLDGAKVKVDLQGQLYEASGGTCGANDLEDTATTTVTTLPNGKATSFGELYLTNAEYCSTYIPSGLAVRQCAGSTRRGFFLRWFRNTSRAIAGQRCCYPRSINANRTVL